METLIENLEHERDCGYYYLRQFCETLSTSELIQVREWWFNPTTNHFDGWGNTHDENKMFIEYLKNQISLKRSEDFLAKLNQRIKS